MSEAPTVERLTGTLGAQVHNLDLATISDDSIYEWISAQLVEHKVLFFRDQNLTSDQHIAFGECFGEVLDVHPWSPSKEGYRKVMVLRGAAPRWHSDESWRDETPLGSILYCRVAPKYGGDTVFADMESAYAGLSSDMKAKLNDLHAIHDHLVHRRGMIHRGVPQQRIEKYREEWPEVKHPVVRTHPISGRKSLYVNADFTSRIDGVDKEESAELLRGIYRLADTPRYQCRFRWEANSIAFWDNRSVQHCGVPDYGEHERLMERVTVAGPKPQ
ncbi:MAG: TauD/TfdA family dioxygenase [Gammaproteobacteria bacterium]|nr:TauD/TfdA family dioxygenase [Gammaproteobacteria bacterium]